MRKTKMENFVALAKKQKNPIALAVSSAIVSTEDMVKALVAAGFDAAAAVLASTQSAFVVSAAPLLKALKDGVSFEHGTKSVTCSVKVTAPDGTILMARGQTQAHGPKLPTDKAEIKKIEDEALLQACEAHLRECELGHYP
jgi:hypothetical protein